jgi:hypothetical protein
LRERAELEDVQRLLGAVAQAIDPHGGHSEVDYELALITARRA